MAMSVAIPPTFNHMHNDALLASLHETSGSPYTTLTCGFQSTSFIKSEPMDSMEHTSPLSSLSSSPCSSSSSSSPQYSSETTYTELKQANFLMMKQGHTDLYPSETSESQNFSSWCFKHPEHWDSREVLDWVFYLADSKNFDGAVFRGEAYNSLTGTRLCSMTRDQFFALDPNYGPRVHEVLRFLLHGACFQKPTPPESFKTETSFGNVPDFACIGCPDDVNAQSSKVALSPSHESKLDVIMDKNEVKVTIDGLWTYDIDTAIDLSDDHFLSLRLEREDDAGYCSSKSPDVFETEPMFSDSEDSADSLAVWPAADLSRPADQMPRCSSSSSDSGYEGDDRRPSPSRRRPPTSTKGNHLWEFVRDLLKDSRFNPSLLKWEDKDLGVFKFVQSEAVAQMWGRKKNNPGMTYEKLSRAMRFCRSAGYFDSIPKTGRFPKKLCFRFGQKAHGWRE